MMTEREALKLALEALDGWRKGFPDNWGDIDTEAVTAIKEALAQPEQEPVAYLDEGLGAFYWAKDYKKHVGFKPLYTAPPQRKPLTDEEALELWNKHEKHWRFENNALAFTRAIEAAHGIKE